MNHIYYHPDKLGAARSAYATGRWTDESGRTISSASMAMQIAADSLDPLEAALIVHLAAIAFLGDEAQLSRFGLVPCSCWGEARRDCQTCSGSGVVAVPDRKVAA